jgi:hypothetical protein
VASSTPSGASSSRREVRPREPRTNWPYCEVRASMPWPLCNVQTSQNMHQAKFAERPSVLKNGLIERETRIAVSMASRLV